MANGRRRKKFAIALMFGVTILAGASAAPNAGNRAALRRFLAVDNASGRSLFTVVTDASTSVTHPDRLKAGNQVRVYGVQRGHTIRARRIEIID